MGIELRHPVLHLLPLPLANRRRCPLLTSLLQLLPPPPPPSQPQALCPPSVGRGSTLGVAEWSHAGSRCLPLLRCLPLSRCPRLWRCLPLLRQAQQQQLTRCRLPPLLEHQLPSPLRCSAAWPL